MFTIYNTIKRMLTDKYSGESEEFKDGYKRAVNLLLIGIKKCTQYNFALRVNELERENKELKKKVDKQRIQIGELIDKLSNKSLLNIVPTENYNTYTVDTGDGEFEIIVNMSKDSFQFCLMNFFYRHTYNRIDECKSILLAFINSRNNQGFRAFKDRKAYNRYVNGKT